MLSSIDKVSGQATAARGSTDGIVAPALEISPPALEISFPVVGEQPRQVRGQILTDDERRELARRAGGKRRQGRHAEADAIRAELLTDHIRRLVDSAPPLTESQRATLAALLRAGAAA